MSRRVFIFMFTASSIAAQLEVGKNYDFYQTNGQNVLGGMLEEESETEYQVRLKYVSKPIILSKANLERPPVLSKVQEPRVGRVKKGAYPDFIVNVTGGYAYATFGQLNSIFKSGFQFGAGADWLIFREPFLRVQSLSLAGSFTLYQDSPRKIQLIAIQAGPKFLIWKIPVIDAAVLGSALAGMSYANLTGYTFTSTYTAFSAAGILHFEKRIKPVIIGLNLYVNYLADSSITFVSTGVGLSVLYPLGGANAF